MPISPVARGRRGRALPQRRPPGRPLRGPAGRPRHRPEPPRPAAQLAQASRSLEASQARLDRVLQAARGGRTFTAGELLALQSDAYRFTQTLDVASKLVEHGVQSVKQAVNAQV